MAATRLSDGYDNIERMVDDAYVYSPWRHLDIAWPHIHVVPRAPLPDGVAGLTNGRTIYLHCRLTQAGRRCTLAHELVHLERGYLAHPPDTREYAREERAVDHLAARRLIHLEQLLDALRWTRHHAELATELWVDRAMLTARLAALTSSERRAITQLLDDPVWGP